MLIAKMTEENDEEEECLLLRIEWLKKSRKKEKKNGEVWVQKIIVRLLPLNIYGISCPSLLVEQRFMVVYTL